MSDDFLIRIRETELERAVVAFPAGVKVLEIGAGAGWQARALAETGFDVTGIDLPTGGYTSARVWPVIDYDGVTIPFSDDSFDLIFSSCVLEHIPDLNPMLDEMKRVLKPGGFAVHVLPTGQWRFWTNVAHYSFGMKFLLSRLVPGPFVDGYLVDRVSGNVSESTDSARIKRILFPSRHGEHGNAVTEIGWFSNTRWRSTFETAGWHVERHYPGGLFYSGYLVLGTVLGIPVRRSLSRVFGSACRVWVVRPE
jgi:SAM-dependent methyltransferase